jgi:adenosylcobinamide kinase/adenosylcobinamide-phosphate guanylyltransferase
MTMEVTHQLVEIIETAAQNSCLVVDSLGTWVANMLEQDDSSWGADGAKSNLELGYCRL